VKALLSAFTVAEVILPDGEQYKTLDTVNTIFTALLEVRFDRSCPKSRLSVFIIH
jgi:3-dehydroquinate synthase